MYLLFEDDARKARNWTMRGENLVQAEDKFFCKFGDQRDAHAEYTIVDTESYMQYVYHWEEPLAPVGKWTRK